MPDLKEQLYPSWPAQVVAHPMVTSSDEDKFRYLQVLTLLIDADDVILMKKSNTFEEWSKSSAWKMVLWES